MEGLIKAIELLVSGDPAVISITLRSIYVSGTATILASLWSIPLGVTLGIKSFRGRKVAKGVFNALLGIPTVALGLLLYLMFSRSGPLGVFQLLYTTTVITIGQAILITPILVSFTASSVESVDPEISSLAKTLGASDTQASFAVLREAVSGLGLAAVASFNRAVAELGIALMLGGNIRGLTRVLTTSIALETGRGEIALGIALAIILLLVVFILSLAVNLISGGRSP